MSDQFCPLCGAFVPAAEDSCAFCQKEVSSMTAPRPYTIDPSAIRHKQNLFLWLLLISIMWGGVNIAIAFTALQIAQEEKEDATIRDIRFNRIEIQSSKYQTLQTVLQTSTFCSRLFNFYFLAVWFQYIRTMGYSRWASFGHILLLFIPLVNLIVFFVMLYKGRKLIVEYSR